MSIVKAIRPSLGFNRLSDDQLVTRAGAIQTGMAGNDAYPNPPIDLATFRVAIDGYAAAITAALDGSKQAKADRQKRREEVIWMLRQLGHYVEAACKGDMKVFLSSGFEATSLTRQGPQPLPQPRIVRVDQGVTGQLLVKIKALREARSYELRTAAVDNSGAPAAWTPTIVATARQAVPVANLVPGTVYTFQVRAVNQLGCTDWSDSVSRMCI